MNNNVIIACDFDSKEKLFDFLKDFEGLNPYLKIGMEMYYKEGPTLVKELKEKGFKIFLDLKLHDIPNTVKKAMKQIGELGVDITNVHAEGGIEMMRAAREGLNESENGKNTKLIAVTVLTSINEEILHNELLVDSTKSVKDTALVYAKNAREAGLDGVVCSAYEAKSIHDLNLISVCPGIRLEGDAKGDQKRVATPEFAKENKATYIVVGRSITGSNNPVEAYKRCLKEFN